MSDLNILVSNGTCYTKAGVKLDASFIPCGNAAFGHVTCCGKGDNCLADNACYGHHGEGYGSDLTYFGGCTDPDYKDGTCPDKKGIDQPWIALTRCDPPSDSEWAPCSQEGNPSTLQPGSFCSCTDAAKTTIAFKDAPTLASFASLPQGTGSEIQFFAGHVPTTPAGGPTGGGGGGGGNGGNGGNGSPSETGAGSSPTGGGSNNGNNGNGGSSGDGGGMANSAKIGLGVGLGLGFLILLAILAFVIHRRRSRRHGKDAAEVEAKTAPPSDDVKPADQRVSAISTYAPTVSDTNGQAVSEADSKEIQPGLGADGHGTAEVGGHAAKPWNVRSELEGNPGATSMAEKLGEGALVSDPHGVYHVRRSGELSPVPELQGTDARPTSQGRGVNVPGARWKIQPGQNDPPYPT